MKKLAVLGSTGSIGRSTLDVVARNRGEFTVVALAAGRNLDLLEQQINEFRPEVVAVADRGSADDLRSRVNGVEVLSGPDGIGQAAAHSGSDMVISAIVGSAGLFPTLAAIRAGKTVALANKEALVMAGELVMKEAMERGVRIIPVDSEHSAVFQCIEGHNRSAVRRIILTASGGPFLNRTKDELSHVKPKDALRHPNWNMGPKITIDSATLMNKGLEVIEAHWIFGLPVESIDVLVHPQSIVHSLVEFRDRCFLAQLSMPDMRGPIAYALSYPERIEVPLPELSLDTIGALTFEKPDVERFPCLSYAYESLRAGGSMPAALNAANEVAVHAFLDGLIGFNDIPEVIRRSMDDHSPRALSDLNDVVDADRRSRESARKVVEVLQT